MSTTDASQIVRNFYTSLAGGDVPAAFGLLADDIVWNEAEGNPLADQNPYTSAGAIGEGVFGRLAAIFDGFAAAPEEFVAQGNRVAVFGRYHGTHKATGEALDCQFVHSWTVSGERIVQFQQYADTAQLARLS